jgi:hypothetical protein
MLVRRLPAWHGNVGKRLVRAPKVYVRDSGLVHTLLGLASLEAVLAHPVAGASWEGLCASNSCLQPQPTADASFYRTYPWRGSGPGSALSQGGDHLGGGNQAMQAAPKVSKGFHLAAADVGATRKLLVAPVDASYPMRDDIVVMNPLQAAMLVDEEQQQQAATTPRH